MAVLIAILKFILILLAVLIIAALLIVALILFAPIRYRVQGSFEEESPSAKLQAKWLAGLLNIKAVYDKEAGISAAAYVFSHRIYDFLSDEEADTESRDISESDITEGKVQADSAIQHNASDENTDGSQLIDAKNADQSKGGNKRAAEAANTESDNTELSKANVCDTTADTAGTEPGPEPEARRLRISVYEAGHPLKRRLGEAREKGISLKTMLMLPFKAAGRILQRAADAVSRIVDKAEDRIRAAVCRLGELFKGIVQAIRMRSTQFRELKAVWDDKRYAKGKALLLDRIVKLLLELKPRSGSGHIRIGRGDPYGTAQVAQLAAFLYPFYADTIEFIPDFDQSILEGSLDVGGRLRLIVPAEAALRIGLNKELKAMYVRARRILGRE